MSGRRLLLLSLIANIALAVGCYFFWHEHQAAITAEALLKGKNSTNIVIQTKLMPVYRKQFFSWGEIESADYEQYIKNLRDIGCPEQTVRDIIVADVNGLFLKKRMAEMHVTNELPWWHTDFDPLAGFDHMALKRLRELTVEQSQLLSRLLGGDWRVSDKTFSALATIQFDGSVLGTVPVQKRLAVYAIMGRAEAERISDHSTGIQSEQMARRELAGILSPEQLEEFLLRYSQNADSLRAEVGQLKYFNITQDEFRGLFHAMDGIYTQTRLLSDSDDPNIQGQIRSLQKQREVAIKAALTPERYAEFVRLHDPAYLEALTTTLASGGKVDMVKTLYAVNHRVAAERAQIQSNTNLTDVQRQIELKTVELTQLQAQAQVTGQLPIEESPPVPPQTPESLPISVYSMLIGDDLKKISERYHIPMSAIRAANPGIDLDNLLPGDRIRIPEPSVRQSTAPFSR